MTHATQSQAKEAGDTYYYNGKPCCRGHICGRFASNRKCIECLKEWRKEKNYGKVHYEANAAVYKQKAREWNRSHPQVINALARGYIARKSSAEGTHTSADVYVLLDKQAWECNGCPANLKHGYHVDHVIPLSRGGSNGPHNLQLLCPSCNCSKGAKTMEEWKAA